MIPSLYLKLAAILIPALVVGTIGYNIGAGRWESKYQALEAQGWQRKAVSETAVRKALEKQLADARLTATTNAEALANVQSVTAAIVADRDQLRSLLARATRSLTASHRMPETSGEPGAPPAGAPSGDGRTARLVELAERTLTECKLNAAQLDGLAAQIQPQL